jgi:hypothetical protein
VSALRRHTARSVLTVGLVLAVAGCGVPPEGSARALTGSQAPFAVLSPAPEGPQPPGARSQQLVFVEDAGLVVVTRPAQQQSPQSALSDLLAGPTPEEQAVGVTTALPAGTATQVRLEGSVAAVDVDGGLLESGRSDQVLALAQVVLTLDALPEVTGVRFLQQGQSLGVPRADGAITDAALTSADYQELVRR